MSKIRVLSDHVANQIAAGEVVERPASVVKELVENAIDAGARRVEVDVEAGGRRLLRVTDDGEGMTRDDAVLAFERHATSKITSAEDLSAISTLGFRGEALASIASVARVELVTQREGETEGTRVLIEGGRMRDVAPAARPRGTTVGVRDLFFNVPARRKFLRSEATESFHLTNLITHYALAHPEIAFALSNNGREVLRCTAAADLRERAYQIFGAEFLENLLAVGGGQRAVAAVRGYVSAPHERRTTRDAQYLFVNGRYVRDRLVARALSEGYRTVLPHGAYPAALLFLEVPLEEVDVNVHPAKTEVRFRRASAVSEAVREAVRAALASAGFARTEEPAPPAAEPRHFADADEGPPAFAPEPAPAARFAPPVEVEADADSSRQSAMEFDTATTATAADESIWRESHASAETVEEAPTEELESNAPESRAAGASAAEEVETALPSSITARQDARPRAVASPLPRLGSAAGLVREVAAESLSHDIRPLGQLADGLIVAADAEGLLLIDQRAAHERILFDKYRALEETRALESQNLLVPETFDLTPAQAAAFDDVSAELDRYGFSLMRLSGRTVAARAVPADLPPGDVRNLLTEILDGLHTERRGRARENMRERIAASLARRAALKSGTALTHEKMRWLVERLLRTSSPTTRPDGRPTVLRLAAHDIERSFQRS